MRGGKIIAKFYTCKYDRAFKEVFAKEENKDILSKLLESILKVEITKIEFLNLERNVDNINVARKHLDLNLETDVGKIQVEINASDKEYVRPRNMSYLCDIYSHHILKGETYNEDTRIMQINFSYGINNKEYIRKYKIQDNEGNKYVNNFIIYEINMDKYNEFWYNKDEKEINKNKYLLMLNLGLEDLENLSHKDKVVSKYMSEIERVNEDPRFREYMSAEEDNRKIQNSLRKEAIEKGLQEGLEQGLQQGLEQGLEQGAHQSKIEIAKSMLDKNMDIELISELTKLSTTEINKLREE